MIRLKDIRFKYGAGYVLDGLDLDIGPGDRVGLYWLANGSGRPPYAIS